MTKKLVKLIKGDYLLFISNELWMSKFINGCIFVLRGEEGLLEFFLFIFPYLWVTKYEWVNSVMGILVLVGKESEWINTAMGIWVLIGKEKEWVNRVVGIRVLMSKESEWTNIVVMSV